MKRTAIALLVAACWALSWSVRLYQPEILWEAAVIDYAFPSDEARQNAIATGKFIPTNNCLAGVKVYNGTIFVTVPRWRFDLKMD